MKILMTKYGSKCIPKNALAAVRFAGLALPIIRKQKWGRLITIASIYGKEG